MAPRRSWRPLKAPASNPEAVPATLRYPLDPSGGIREKANLVRASRENVFPMVEGSLPPAAAPGAGCSPEADLSLIHI